MSLVLLQDAVICIRFFLLPASEYELHRRERHSLGRLHHVSVATRDGNRRHPQRDHGGEVEGSDASAVTQRLANRVTVHVRSHALTEFSHVQRGRVATVRRHLQTSEDILLGVRDGALCSCVLISARVSLLSPAVPNATSRADGQ